MADGAITGIYGWAVRLRRDPQCGYRYGPAGPGQVDSQGNLHDRAVMDGGVTARKSRYDWMMEVGLSPPAAPRRGTPLSDRRQGQCPKRHVLQR